MSGAASRCPPCAWPIGLLGMLTLVATIESVIAGHEGKGLWNSTITSWRFASRAVRRDAHQSEILCFGDSMVKFGVEPLILEERLGRRSYNLALYGGPPAASFFLLRRTLEAGAKPSALIVDFPPHQLGVSPRFFVREWPHLATLGECLDLTFSTRDASFFASLVLGKLFPSYRDRQGIRTCVFAALRGESKSVWKAELAPLVRNWNRNRGAQASPREPGFDGRFNPRNLGLFPPEWSCNRTTLRYVQRFLALAAARKIPVFWLLPPITPQPQARREQLGLDAQFNQLVRSVQAAFPSVTIIDGRGSGYASSVYIDSVHLDRRGAALLSHDLASLLETTLNDPARPHWLHLANFQDRPVDVSLEDVNQSRAALKLR